MRHKKVKFSFPDVTIKDIVDFDRIKRKDMIRYGLDWDLFIRVFDKRETTYIKEHSPYVIGRYKQQYKMDVSSLIELLKENDSSDILWFLYDFETVIGWILVVVNEKDRSVEAFFEMTKRSSLINSTVLAIYNLQNFFRLLKRQHKGYEIYATANSIEVAYLIEKSGFIRYQKNQYIFSCKLIHYTTLSAFEGIFGNGEFWFSDISQVNDKKERVLYIETKISEIMVSADDEKKKILEDLRQKIRQYTKKSHYIFCLSSNYDDASQWERYGDNGKGIGIVFNREFFELLETPTSCDPPPEEILHLRSVNYQLRDACNFIENYIDAEDPIIKAMYFDWILSISMEYKHNSFQNEKEIRAILEIPSACEKQQYANVRGNLKHYYPYQWKVACENKNIAYEDLISEILIGPRSEIEPSMMAGYLKRLGYNGLANKIKKSECPLR